MYSVVCNNLRSCRWITKWSVFFSLILLTWCTLARNSHSHCFWCVAALFSVSVCTHRRKNNCNPLELFEFKINSITCTVYTGLRQYQHITSMNVLQRLGIHCSPVLIQVLVHFQRETGNKVEITRNWNLVLNIRLCVSSIWT